MYGNKNPEKYYVHLCDDEAPTAQDSPEMNISFIDS